MSRIQEQTNEHEPKTQPWKEAVASNNVAMICPSFASAVRFKKGETIVMGRPRGFRRGTLFDTEKVSDKDSDEEEE